MLDQPVFTSHCDARTAVTVIARIGFGACGLVYLLVGAFALAAAFNVGKQPHVPQILAY
jgi:hypothetical protein